ncbi:MAG: dTMP kinase [Bacteroidia bacterium]|jgi:dTMP kinase|nr:dTMP kinase [Bacteroidales bacterium]MDD3299499.1 dTMP kinase [Bacteroidales bacterium]MDD3844243.1 dTMP kinase [Bacteroidales bacterium]MDD4618671.1 dTMP kinase [Bacteroidales bacterium]NCC45555.1 dTMP kinase [Bacteroidia bacterium]
MLIVLEGLDGAGKSTQIGMLREYFENRGEKVQFLHFPRFDAPVYGTLIARFLRGDFGSIESVHPMLVALLFAEDRRDASAVIRTWLDKGSVVILDRYIYSNIAFQCAKANPSFAQELRDWIFETEFGKYKIPVPDLNLFLDVPLQFVNEKLSGQRDGIDRDYLQGKKDIHESDIEFQKMVRQIYLQECKREEGLIRVDCGSEMGDILPATEISAKILTLVNNI